LQDPPKFTQIWIFGLKTNHLATLFIHRHFHHPGEEDNNGRRKHLIVVSLCALETQDGEEKQCF
jgi:hypothetical protein